MQMCCSPALPAEARDCCFDCSTEGGAAARPGRKQWLLRQLKPAVHWPRCMRALAPCLPCRRAVSTWHAFCGTLPRRVRYPVSAINILKAHGKSARDSRMLDGYALNLGRAAQVRGRPAAACSRAAVATVLCCGWGRRWADRPDRKHDPGPLLNTPFPPPAFVQGMPKSIKGARIACLDMNLQKARMLFGVQVGNHSGGSGERRALVAGLALQLATIGRSGWPAVPIGCTACLVANAC